MINFLKIMKDKMLAIKYQVKFKSDYVILINCFEINY